MWVCPTFRSIYIVTCAACDIFCFVTISRIAQPVHGGGRATDLVEEFVQLQDCQFNIECNAMLDNVFVHTYNFVDIRSVYCNGSTWLSQVTDMADGSDEVGFIFAKISPAIKIGCYLRSSLWLCVYDCSCTWSRQIECVCARVLCTWLWIFTDTDCRWQSIVYTHTCPMFTLSWDVHSAHTSCNLGFAQGKELSPESTGQAFGEAEQKDGSCFGQSEELMLPEFYKSLLFSFLFLDEWLLILCWMYWNMKLYDALWSLRMMITSAPESLNCTALHCIKAMAKHLRRVGHQQSVAMSHNVAIEVVKKGLVGIVKWFYDIMKSKKVRQ